MPVSRGIGGIVELSGNERAGHLRGELFRLFYRARHALAAVREHKLRAVGFKQSAPLNAHRFRHGNYEPITLGQNYDRQNGLSAKKGYEVN